MRVVRWGPSADNSLSLAQKHTSAFTYVHYFTFEDCCKYFTMINNSKFWGFFSVQIIASRRLTEDQGFQVFWVFFVLLFVYVNPGHFCFHPNIQTPPKDVRGKSKSLGWKATPDLSFIHQAIQQLSEQPALCRVFFLEPGVTSYQKSGTGSSEPWQTFRTIWKHRCVLNVHWLWLAVNITGHDLS